MGVPVIYQPVPNNQERRKTMAKKKAIPKGQQRQMRTQQIVMGIIGVLIVLSMVISMLAR